MPPLIPGAVAGPVGRLSSAAQNALEVARFGGLVTDERSAPYEIAAEHRVYRLRHYYAGEDVRNGSEPGPPVVQIPSPWRRANVSPPSATLCSFATTAGLRYEFFMSIVRHQGSTREQAGGLLRVAHS